jgi:2-polyprenyl-3-methyl-5-hydroxy-6-metoxy-1,4-benzoquinol methylase
MNPKTTFMTLNTEASEGKATPEASVSSCVVCGGVLGVRPVVKLRSASLFACTGCRTWAYFPRPTPAEQAAIHDNDEYFEHPYFQHRRGTTPQQRRRCRELFKRVGTVVELLHLRGERLLDVGCDTGGFLLAAQEEVGIVPVGLDVAHRSIEQARREGIEGYCTALEAAPPELTNFRMITAIDLIEHVVDPLSLLSEIRSRLAPGGIAYLETPHIRSSVYRFGKMLAAIAGTKMAPTLERLFPAQHLHHFTTESFGRLVRSAGLEPASITTRVLPPSDLAVSKVAQLPIQLLQILDRIAGWEILITAVLRRPLTDRS